MSVTRAQKRAIYLLTFAASALSIGHHVDHLIRGNVVGWPLTPEINAFTLAWISTPTPEEHGQQRGDYPLEIAIWPPGSRTVVARMDNPGETIAWIGQDAGGQSARRPATYPAFG